MTPPHDPHAGPWYRHAWPWFMVILLGTTVVAGISTVFIAVIGADPPVMDDYYRKGKSINRTLATDHEAELREASARLSFDAGVAGRLTGKPSRQVSVVLEILGDEPASLDLDLSHITIAELDVRFRLERNSEGVYVTSGGGMSGALPLGQFYATLRPSGSDAAWRLRKRIVLPSGRPIQFGTSG
ncbi:MAG: hypothetical protein ACI8W3_001537 [Myxococcota bacterium]|jgi:hypothetical protein